MASMRHLETAAHGAAERASRDGLEKLARFGFFAKGAVYGLIGFLALLAALGLGGEIEGSRGVIHDFARQPFGKVLLALTAIGLVGYAFWRFVQAVKDPDGVGSDAAGILRRTGYAVSGLLYLGLAFVAIRPLLGLSGGGEGQQGWTAQVMAQPFGRWIVGIAGAIIAGVGVYHFYTGVKTRFTKRFAVAEMSAGERNWFLRAGRFGLTARGVTFVLIGIFLVQAALQAQPSEARGVGGALRTLAQQPYGPWLLGVVSAGFVAYGLYCFFAARYRRLGMGEARRR